MTRLRRVGRLVYAAFDVAFGGAATSLGKYLRWRWENKRV